MINDRFYESPRENWWQGRIDGSEGSAHRWHQQVQLTALSDLERKADSQSVIFLGFSSDEGVLRNLGRTGAVKGPEALRKACCNLPVHFSSKWQLWDAGNIVCRDGQLEEAQVNLSAAVSICLSSGGFPVLLGGGHEITYGHYGGLRKAFAGRKIGIINFDAHFDLRAPGKNGPNSGTGFFQIATDAAKAGDEFFYMALGIQRSGNTRALFESASKFGVQFVSAQAITQGNRTEVLRKVSSFIDQLDILYLSFDLDVFASAYAPGVSAPTAAGLCYDGNFQSLIDLCFKSGKVYSIDIAELNPRYDLDNRTAILGAQIIFDCLLALDTNPKIN